MGRSTQIPHGYIHCSVCRTVLLPADVCVCPTCFPVDLNSPELVSQLEAVEKSPLLCDECFWKEHPRCTIPTK